jgi:hypothetical protein
MRWELIMSKPLLAWARHTTEKRFHAAYTLEDVTTGCCGSWEEQWTAEVVELAQRPLFVCTPCLRVVQEQEQAAGDERAKAAIVEAERSGV